MTTARVPADVGRAAVAAAEAAAFGGTDLDAPVERAHLGERVAEVVGGPWWRSAGPTVSVVAPRGGSRSSSARPGSAPESVEIRLADEQRTVATVAHELAHALAGVVHGHDPVFRSAYVDVVSMLAGAGAATALDDAFGAFDLVVAPRRWPAPWRLEGDDFRVVP